MTTTLHVGTAIHAWLHHRYAQPADSRDPYESGALLPLGAIPLIENAELHHGRWEIRTDGEVISSGQVGPDDAIVAYVPRVGFVAMRAPDTFWITGP